MGNTNTEYNLARIAELEAELAKLRAEEHRSALAAEAERRSARQARARTAAAEIADLIKQAKAAIAAAQHISDESGVGFHWDLEYGMNGWYRPALHEGDDGWEESAEVGWQASSNSC